MKQKAPFAAALRSVLGLAPDRLALRGMAIGVGRALVRRKIHPFFSYKTISDKV